MKVASEGDATFVFEKSVEMDNEPTNFEEPKEKLIPQDKGEELTSDKKTRGLVRGTYRFTADSLKKKVRLSEFISEKVITGVAFLTITIIVLIFLFVFRETLPLFRQHSQKVTTTAQVQEQYGSDEGAGRNAGNQEVYGITKDSITSADNSRETIEPGNNEGRVIFPDKATFKGLWGKEWMPVSDKPRYGLMPLILGTFKISILAILFAAPLAILAALFSAAFSPKWLREIIKPAIELLAGFPSVVIGFFALMVMASVFQNFFGYSTRLNAFVGGIAMALAAIPIIFTMTEDVMTAVPESYKEASLALGASKWQTAFYVTLPAATPGIFAAILLGIGRIFGETMIALMATGNAALISMNPFESVRTLSATIGAEMAEVVFGDTHYSVLFLIGSLLFIFTFALNAFAEFYVKGKMVARFQGRIA
ncbi:MAG: phosphate ABC transporter permease subunit PstC [Bacteroidetes bacterium]|nr:phosphate ABC transporter permease subunit PstC [Bacteroidota bacterium]